MAYIELVGEDEACGAVARVYQQAKSRSGGIANILRVMSQDGAVLSASMRFYIELMKTENALSNSRKEMLAAVVSNVNDCYY